MDDILTLLLLLAVLWFWWDSRGVAEQAITVARKHCEKLGLTFLNDTVAWKRIRLRRNKRGRMQIQRSYFFEFASDMQQRYSGEIVMLGKQTVKVNLDTYRISE